MKICDKCMSQALKNDSEIRPHSVVFGANGTRWFHAICDACGTPTNCVDRSGLVVEDGVVKPYDY